MKHRFLAGNKSWTIFPSLEGILAQPMLIRSDTVTDKTMKQLATPKTFQAKPSNLKKKIALVAFIVGAISFTLALTRVLGVDKGAYFFAGGITAMIFAFRFWNMQVHNPMAVTFTENGISIIQGSSNEMITWPELESIRYKVWRGGHFWEFKKRGRESTFDYYLDGLTSSQIDELRQTVASIDLPGILIQTEYRPFDVQAERILTITDAVGRSLHAK